MTGPVLVGIAAILWATDAFFRMQAVSQLNPAFIVFVEHLVIVLALLPFLLRQSKKQLNLKSHQWVAALLTGVGGSAVATILFTTSFMYVNPSVTILLQKLQPIICVILSLIILREIPRKGFFLWAPIALLAGLVLSFPDVKFLALFQDPDLRASTPQSARGVIYALSAAGLWAASTVGGKIMLKGTTAITATFWRFSFGLAALLVILLYQGFALGNGFSMILASAPLGRSLLYMALIPGLIATVIYYAGLSRTRASVATFVELLFPVAAVFINTYLLQAPLNPVQIGATAVLLFSVTAISVGK